MSGKIFGSSLSNFILTFIVAFSRFAEGMVVNTYAGMRQSG